MKKKILLAIMLAAAAVAFAQTADWDKPSFGKSSGAAVELSYKFSQGAVISYTIYTDTTTTVDVMGQLQEIPMIMTIEGIWKVKSKNADGSAVIESTITRMIGKISTGFMVIDYDTSDPATMATPGIGDFMLIIDTPFLSTVTKKGKVTSNDLSAVEAKITGSQMGPSLLQTLNESAEHIFIQLPDKKVRKGDSFAGATMVKEVPGMGSMTSNVSYKIADISSDKKLVLLIPEGDISMDAITAQTMEGWLLFDAGKGILAKSIINMSMEMTVTDPSSGTAFDMTIDTDVKYTAE